MKYPKIIYCKAVILWGIIGVTVFFFGLLTGYGFYKENSLIKDPFSPANISLFQRLHKFCKYRNYQTKREKWNSRTGSNGKEQKITRRIVPITNYHIKKKQSQKRNHIQISTHPSFWQKQDKYQDISFLLY